MNRTALLSIAALLAACGTSSSTRAPASAPPSPSAEYSAAQPRSDVLLARARALRAEGDLAGARGRLEAAYLASPGSDEVRLELADLLVADGRELDRAGALLEGVRSPDGARWHLLGAQLAEARGDDLRAEAAYARAVAAGADPEARLRRALALERLGRVFEATWELERVRAERPEDPIVRARLAERYEGAGRLPEAEAELRAIAEAQPDRSAGWERLARFYERTGRPADARAALARARDLGERNGRALRPLLPSKR